MKTHVALMALVLVACSAHAVEKCVKDGKVIYTDRTCASLGAKTQKSFDPPDNTVMSAKTQYLRYKVAKNMPYPSEPPSHNVRQSPTPVASNNQAACEQVNRQLEENAWNARQRHVAEAQDYLSDLRRKLWDEYRRLKCGNP